MDLDNLSSVRWLRSAFVPTPHLAERSMTLGILHACVTTATSLAETTHLGFKPLSWTRNATWCLAMKSHRSLRRCRSATFCETSRVA